MCNGLHVNGGLCSTCLFCILDHVMYNIVYPIAVHVRTQVGALILYVLHVHVRVQACDKGQQPPCIHMLLMCMHMYTCTRVLYTCILPPLT